MRSLVHAQEPQPERASPPRGPWLAGLEEPLAKAPVPQALPPPEDALVRQVQQQEPGRLAPQADAQPPSLPLLWRCARIQRRSRRLLHPSGGA